MKRHLDEIEHMGNPLKAFIRESCKIEPNAKITSDALHKGYAEYVSEGGNSPMAKNKMSSAIRDMHIGVSVGEWMRWNNRPTRCLKGIRLRNEYDGDPEEPEYTDDPLLFAPPPMPTPPGSGTEQNTQEETEQAPGEAPAEEETIVSINQEELRFLEYPESMSHNMEPPPTEPCERCGQAHYVPYWGKWGTKMWGCGICFPQIEQKIGLYNPDNPQ